MKKICKIVCFFVMFFLFAFLPATGSKLLADETNTNSTSVSEQQDMDTILACPKIDSLTTEYANAYQTADDQITYVIDANKINYKDTAGNWQEVNDEIVCTKDASNGYAYQNAANDFVTSFGINDKGMVVTKIEKSGYSIEFSVQADLSVSLSNDNGLDKTDTEYLNQLNSQKNSIIYKNVFPSADLAYTEKAIH